MTPATAPKVFPLAAVVFWLTPTVERDYIARNAFPALRTATAVELRSGGSRHMLTLAEAADVLADAASQYEKTQRGVKLAYGRLQHWLNEEIQCSQKRMALAALEHATQRSDVDWRESWHGTRRQLEASGFMIEGALPGESGAASTKARILDRRGYPATAFATPWNGLFDVTVHIPAEVSKRLAEAAAADKERRAEESRIALVLQYAPATPEAFREDVNRRFWNHVKCIRDELRGGCGYRMDDQTIEKFTEAVSKACDAIFLGCVTGKSLHEHIASNRLEAARKDAGLQRFLTACRSESE